MTAEELQAGLALEGDDVPDTEILMSGIPAAEAARTGSA